MNKSELVELRNNLISKNNFDKDKIDEYIEKCEEKQTEFMNKRSFNLYKYDNIILNNLLDMIHYFLQEVFSPLAGTHSESMEKSGFAKSA